MGRGIGALMATYSAEVLSPPTAIIEGEKAPRDAEIVLEADQLAPRVEIDTRQGIVRRSRR